MSKMTSLRERKLACLMLEFPSTSIVTYYLRWINSQQRKKATTTNQHSLHSNNTPDSLGQSYVLILIKHVCADQVCIHTRFLKSFAFKAFFGLKV